jgi:hypothetical protein
MKLKKVLLITFVLSYTNSIFSQNRELILYKLDSLKKGVYKSFKEFKYNNPSFQITLDVKHVKDILMTDPNSEIMPYAVHYNKDSFKLNNHNFWGFCDGKDIFINNLSIEKPNGKIMCQKILHVDYYCYFLASRSIPDYMVSKNIGANYQDDNSVLIFSLKTGEVFRLNINSLKYLFEANDPELLESFKAEKNKNKMLQEYLQKYCDRHRDEL